MNNNEKEPMSQKGNPGPIMTNNLYIDNFATAHENDNVIMGFKNSKTEKYRGGYYLANNKDTIQGVGIFLMILETIESVYDLNFHLTTDTFGRVHIAAATFVKK